MKKFIRWLAKVFDADITVEKVVEKTVERTVYLPPEGGVIEGDLYVKGSIAATGYIAAKEDITAKGTMKQQEGGKDGKQ